MPLRASPAYFNQDCRCKLFCKIGFNLSKNCGSGEAELLIKYLVGCRCSEVVKTEYFAVATYYAAKGRGKTGGKTEYLAVGGNNAVAVILRLYFKQAD